MLNYKVLAGCLLSLVASQASFAEIRCKSVSNGYSFWGEGRTLSEAVEKAVKACGSKNYTSLGACSGNVTCQKPGDEDVEPVGFSCMTTSKGYTFNGGDVSSVEKAMNIAIRECTSKTYTVAAQCNANIVCGEKGGSLLRPAWKCMTTSAGNRYEGGGRNQNQASREALYFCQSRGSTNPIECENNLRCAPPERSRTNNRDDSSEPTIIIRGDSPVSRGPDLPTPGSNDEERPTPPPPPGTVSAAEARATYFEIRNEAQSIAQSLLKIIDKLEKTMTPEEIERFAPLKQQAQAVLIRVEKSAPANLLYPSTRSLLTFLSRALAPAPQNVRDLFTKDIARVKNIISKIETMAPAAVPPAPSEPKSPSVPSNPSTPANAPTWPAAPAPAPKAPAAPAAPKPAPVKGSGIQDLPS